MEALIPSLDGSRSPPISSSQSSFIHRSVSAPCIAENVSEALLPSYGLRHTERFNGDNGNYYQNVPSRLNPRMVAPKPMRTTAIDDKSVLGYFGDTSKDSMGILDESLGLDSSSNDLLATLLLDKKPRTPLDRIDEDFPSVPSTLYSHLRNLSSAAPEDELLMHRAHLAATQQLSRPMSAEPSLGMRVGNSTPYNNHSPGKPLDDLALEHATKAMNGLYMNDLSSQQDINGRYRNKAVATNTGVGAAGVYPMQYGQQNQLQQPPQQQTQAGVRSGMPASIGGGVGGYVNGSMAARQQPQPMSSQLANNRVPQQQQQQQQQYRSRGPTQPVAYGGGGGVSGGVGDIDQGYYMPQAPQQLSPPSLYMDPAGQPMYYRGNESMYNTGTNGLSGLDQAALLPMSDPLMPALGYQMQPNDYYGHEMMSAAAVAAQQARILQQSRGGVYPLQPAVGYVSGNAMMQQQPVPVLRDYAPPMHYMDPSQVQQQSRQLQMDPRDRNMSTNNNWNNNNNGRNGGQQQHQMRYDSGMNNNNNNSNRRDDRDDRGGDRGGGRNNRGDQRRDDRDSMNNVNNNSNNRRDQSSGSRQDRNNYQHSNDRNNDRNNDRYNGRNSNNGHNNNNNTISSSNTSGGGIRDSAVEEFRNTYGKSRQWEIRDLVGHVVAFCQDQHGSRFIQQRLEVASEPEKQVIFDEILVCADSLMTDVFGNYVIQKLFEYGAPAQCETLAAMLCGLSTGLAMQMYGCRVIQKALEYVSTQRLIILVAEFDTPHILDCIHDQNGNHVIQKCIEIVSKVAREASGELSEYLASRIQFILSAFTGNVRGLSMHPYGCRVVQRILEYCTDAQKAPVLDELRACCSELVLDQYGNYVIQHVMQHGWDEDRAVLIKEVQSHLLAFSQHKFASNVVEKCLQHANKKDRDEMIWTLINVTFDLNSPVDAKTGHCVLESMVRDPYANYVVQKVIDVSDDKQRSAIMRYVKENIVQLRRYTYGKHIIVRLEKITNDKF